MLQDLAWKLATELGWVDTTDAEYVALTTLQADALITLDQDLAQAFAISSTWRRSRRFPNADGAAQAGSGSNITARLSGLAFATEGSRGRMSDRLNPEDLAAEAGTALPDKEAMSLLDLNAELDLALDLAAPIDAAVAGNLNVALPIDAAVSANILSFGSSSTAVADQDAAILQTLDGNAEATADQQSTIDQAEPLADGTTAVDDPMIGASDALLNVNADLNLDADVAAPIAAAVGVNANVAAPIDAAVSANIGSIGSESVAIADQDAVIVQELNGDAVANATQDSTIEQ